MMTFTAFIKFTDFLPLSEKELNLSPVSCSLKALGIYAWIKSYHVCKRYQIIQGTYKYSEKLAKQ